MVDALKGAADILGVYNWYDVIPFFPELLLLPSQLPKVLRELQNRRKARAVAYIRAGDFLILAESGIPVFRFAVDFTVTFSRKIRFAEDLEDF